MSEALGSTRQEEDSAQIMACDIVCLKIFLKEPRARYQTRAAKHKLCYDCLPSNQTQ